MNAVEQFLQSLPKPYLSPRIETKESPIAGVGQFARQDLSVGEVIAIEKGVIVESSVVKAVEDAGYSLDTCIDWGTYFLMGPLDHGGEQGIINHSCDPNVGFLDDGVYVTIRPVHAGEELCCDYGTFETMEGWSMSCKCESPHCRGTITSRDYLLPALQTRLGRWFMPYLRRQYVPKVL